MNFALRLKEWPGKIIYLNFDSIFGDFFLKSNTKYKKVKSAAEN